MKKILHLLLIISISLIIPLQLSALDVQKDIIEKAKQYIGTPYRYGGTTPKGFDCSGFVHFIYRDYVPGISRTSDILSRTGTKISRKDLLPGDLTFWATTGNPAKVSHVAIYIGRNRIIHAISEGPNGGISITDMNSPYWKDRFLFGRRILKTNAPAQKKPLKHVGAEKSVPEGHERVKTVLGVYTGEIKNGQPHGTGVYRLNNGDIYSGKMVNGRFHGQGVYTSTKGTVWEGNFKNGVLNGKAVRIWASGEVYEGEYHNGLESGGWYTDKNGRISWVYRSSGGDWIIDREKTKQRAAENEKTAAEKRKKKDSAAESGPTFEDFLDSEQSAFNKHKNRK